MTEEIQQSIVEVSRAIEKLNQAFEKRAVTLRQGGDSKELQQWMTATNAMRDSGNIYLSWAKHYARTAGTEVMTDESELDELDEGGTWPEQQPMR